MDNFLVPKSSKNFYCEKCDYSTSRRSQWTRHIATAKHLMDNLDNKKVPNNFKAEYMCECGKSYNYMSGLCKHKKMCNKTNLEIINSDVIDKLLEQNITLITQNQEFKQLLIDQNSKMMELANKNNTVINNTTNNTFNMQFFLNVQCKDALNIVEFVNSLKVQIHDLEETGRLGYIDGISRIFINGLNELDVNKRPIHCSDLKRETIYIKDQDIWEKENDNRQKLKQAIRTIASKNIKQIPVWQKEHPEYVDSSSKINDKYLRIVSNSMNGLTIEETQKNYDKIISKVAREVVIQKE